MEDGVTEAETKLIEEGKALQKQVNEWVFRLKTHSGADGSQPPLDQEWIEDGAAFMNSAFRMVIGGIHEVKA